MPIDIKEFEDIVPMKKGCSIHSMKILSFLKLNKDKAFTYKELLSIDDKIDVKKIHGYLSYLKKVGKIRHKTPYFAFNEELPQKQEQSK